jgi:hypothetical protein
MVPRNFDKSQIPNSFSKSSATSASAITFFAGVIVQILLPGLIRMFELMLEKFLRISNVFLLNFT